MLGQITQPGFEHFHVCGIPMCNTAFRVLMGWSRNKYLRYRRHAKAGNIRRPQDERKLPHRR
eukprot:931143-Alexandrium_andersonii.AAC.1